MPDSHAFAIATHLVREKFPRIPRRVSGYNLDELLPENGFHVARALVGSEGTCATVLSAKLNLAASPPFRVLNSAGIPGWISRGGRGATALEHGPIGLEGFDHMLVDFMRRKGLALKQLDQLPPGVGFLLGRDGRMECGGGTAKAEKLARDCRAWPVRQWRTFALRQRQQASGMCANLRSGHCVCARRTGPLGGMGRCCRSTSQARSLSFAASLR